MTACRSWRSGELVVELGILVVLQSAPSHSNTVADWTEDASEGRTSILRSGTAEGAIQDTNHDIS
jgi:hypothetical protein